MILQRGLHHFILLNNKKYPPQKWILKICSFFSFLDFIKPVSNLLGPEAPAKSIELHKNPHTPL